MADEAWSAEQFRQKYEEQAAKIGRFNLAVFGKTGVGKSTLINAVFGEDVAPTGIGEPVTMDGHLYVHRSGFLGLYDTRGLEIGNDTDTLIGEIDKLVKANRKQPVSEQIHAAWYCIRSTDRRFEDTEAEFVRRLDAIGLPVVAVLTQVPSRDGAHHADAVALADHIASLGLPIAGGRPVLVMAESDDFTGQVEHGLKDLLDATFRVVPNAVQAAVAAAQRIDLDRKRASARTVVGSSVAAAALVGAVPIPVADAAVLVPIQGAMIAGISACYGLKLSVVSIAAEFLPALAAVGGTAAAASLLKLVPGLGSVVSATVAGTLTGAIGSAWMAVCDLIVQDKLKGIDQLLDHGALRKVFEDTLKATLQRDLRAKRRD